MKRFLTWCLAIISCASLAQQLPTGTQTSPNLVYSTVNPYPNCQGCVSPGSWSGFTTTESTGGGLSGGNQPGYNVSTGTFMFGYQQGTVAYNYAVSTALRNSGMSWLGYNYSWEYINQGTTRGTLSANVNFTSTNGTVLHTRNWTMGQTGANFETVSGTELFNPALNVANISSFGLSFTGKDDRFWAGYYGPQVRNPSISVLYTFDQCSSNPLSSPDCPGYAQAYHDQQCVANPLYASDCPGYAVAYQTQQCTINSLYSPQCPGYAVAYHDQQCSLNPLYATDCLGYAAAFKAQQCTLNQLYATDCPGYETAYKAQQCTLNQLYATDCPGYAQAYFNQQCNLNGLYDRTCPNYNTAYAKTQLLTQQSTTTSSTTTITKTDPAVQTTTSAATTGISDTTVATSVASTTNNNTTSQTSPTSVTGSNSVINQPPPPGANITPIQSAITSISVNVPPTQAQQQERQQDQKKTDGAVASVEKKSGGDKKEAGKQVAAAAKEAAEKAKNATSLEAQVANQGLVVGLMGYVPGFTAYQNSLVPDINQINMARQYSKPNVDNASLQRRLNGANENKWREMVDSQYTGR